MNCLCRGFPSRKRAYWSEALDRASQRPIIAGCPRYGYLLESREKVVGVLLTLSTRYGGGAAEFVRCNHGSWCVDEPYRASAMRLVKLAIGRKDFTHLNTSPAPHTLRMVKALRLSLYCKGQIAFLPLLSAPRSRGRVLEFSDGAREAALLSSEERRMLSEHVEFGCQALIGVEDGQAFPFIFRRRRILKNTVPCRQLIYCRSISELTRWAGAIGRYWLREGTFLCVADANGKITGLAGRYFEGRGEKYFKGPFPPEPGDLSYTELAVFGP